MKSLRTNKSLVVSLGCWKAAFKNVIDNEKETGSKRVVNSGVFLELALRIKLKKKVVRLSCVLIAQDRFCELYDFKTLD